MSDNRYFSKEDKFNFACHQGLACFNSCCRDISIFLSPYDVLRLKKALQISSQQFLDQYTYIINTGSGFPMVVIRMPEENDKRCPFVTDKGCSVYQARPWSCRMAPVDIKGENQFGFCFDSSQCQGLLENKQWTVNEWAENQGVDLEQKIEKTFNEIPARVKFTGLSAIDRHIREMFLMACYNLDKFRRFIFDSSFLHLFEIPEDVAERIKDNDLELMEFGFDWLVNHLDIRKSIAVRDQVFG
ncbi:YkgJ family cysteine cluster protein [Desulfofalx alkaliphila]|uniref:YkgJ family cysteine cluster protein n=1 Tax=Desulfofalx alkaliphila TaxID=105483 RepID=UPI0004E233D7|nr:YkgJ family cysteine cluster protein [Desulfofalx alkaliphila]